MEINIIKETAVVLSLIVPLSISPKMTDQAVDDVIKHFPKESYREEFRISKLIKENEIRVQDTIYTTDNKHQKNEKLLYDSKEYDRNISSFKTFMDYTAITDNTSKQYKLQKKAHTDSDGLRKVGNYYCVAVGKGVCQNVGTKLVLEKSNGQKINAIVSDIKSDKDTDHTKIFMKENNTMLEFVVDINKMDDWVVNTGDISNIEKFQGKINKIYKL